MAISFVNSSLGGFSSATGSIVVGYPFGYQVGDMLVLFLAGKPYNPTITTPSGWTALPISTNGVTANGLDTGSTFIQAFYQIATGSGGSSITVSVLGSPSPVMGIMHAYRTTASWDTPVSTGVTTITNTWTALTSVSQLLLPQGAYLPIVFVSMTDSSNISTSNVISATGRSINGYFPSPVSPLTTTTGNDGGMVAGYRTVTSASDTTPRTVTLSTTGPLNERGHAYIVQLNEPISSSGSNFFPFF